MVDVLTGAMQLEPQIVITPSQRLFYDYRIHRPSLDAECTSGSAPQRPRDFRSLRERERETG
jgi:hypothetical protein